MTWLTTRFCMFLSLASWGTDRDSSVQNHMCAKDTVFLKLLLSDYGWAGEDSLAGKHKDLGAIPRTQVKGEIKGPWPASLDKQENARPVRDVCLKTWGRQLPRLFPGLHIHIDPPPNTVSYPGIPFGFCSTDHTGGTENDSYICWSSKQVTTIRHIFTGGRFKHSETTGQQLPHLPHSNTVPAGQWSIIKAVGNKV